MVGGRHKQILDVILIDGLHTLDSLSATVLRLEIIHRHSLDISKSGHGDYGIVPGNQVFHGNIKFIISDLTSSVVAILLGDCRNFGLDHAKQKLFIRKDRLVFCDLKL